MTAVRHLLIPAAGLGTRMRMVDAERPKEMLPLNGKPAISHTVAEGVDAGVERVIVIIRHGKEMIREALVGVEAEVIYLYQEVPRGEADALALAEPLVGREPVAVAYPDVVHWPGPGALKRLAAHFSEHELPVIALTEVTADTAHSFGNAGRVDLEPLQGELFHVRRLHAKGPGHFILRFPGEMRTCGMWVAGEDLFDHLRGARNDVPMDREFSDSAIMRRFLAGPGLLAARVPGTFFDVGRPEGYYRCVAAMDQRGGTV